MPPMDADHAALLRKPFAPEDIDRLPKPYQANSEKGNCRECGQYHGLPAVHLDYAGHAAVTDRLLEVDPTWTWEPVPNPAAAGLPVPDKGIYMWITLTVCGVTRYGFGDASGKVGANAVKEAIGDALRNASMRFGVGLDLWRKDDRRSRAQDTDDEPGPLPDDEVERRALMTNIIRVGAALGRTKDDLAAEFAQEHDGLFIGDGSLEQLRAFFRKLQSDADR